MDEAKPLSLIFPMFVGKPPHPPLQKRTDAPPTNTETDKYPKRFVLSSTTNEFAASGVSSKRRGLSVGNNKSDLEQNVRQQGKKMHCYNY